MTGKDGFSLVNRRVAQRREEVCSQFDSGDSQYHTDAKRIMHTIARISDLLLFVTDNATLKVSLQVSSDLFGVLLQRSFFVSLYAIKDPCTQLACISLTEICKS